MPGMTRKGRDRRGRRKREEREKERKEEKKGDRKGRKKERKKGSKDRKGRGKREWVWKCIMVDRKKDTKGALGIECLYHLWQVSQWSLLLLCFFFSCFCRVGHTVGVCDLTTKAGKKRGGGWDTMVDVVVVVLWVKWQLVSGWCVGGFAKHWCECLWQSQHSKTWENTQKSRKERLFVVFVSFSGCRYRISGWSCQ